MFRITTDRLILLPLTMTHLETGLNSTRVLSNGLGIRLTSHLFEGVVERAVKLKLEKMSAVEVKEHFWFTYWLIVIKQEEVGVGLVGFKGLPNARGEVEIGYGIGEEYQGQGYMSEAVQALIKWAFGHPECRAVTATGVKIDNFASQKVLKHAGFSIIEERDALINFRLDRP